jgi:hypothetical protein
MGHAIVTTLLDIIFLIGSRRMFGIVKQKTAQS